MSNKKQSSLNWFSNKTYELFEQFLNGEITRLELSELMVESTKQAESMHKEEIVDAYTECWMNDGGNGSHKVEEAETYYNETFGGGNES